MSTNEQDDDEDGPPRRKATAPRLKITLKLPVNNAGSTSAGTATPDEIDYAAFKRTPKRRGKAKIIPEDIESEDESSPSDSDEGASTQEPPSRSTGTPTTGTGTRPMTTRQAVLASVVDPTHVSLNEGSRSKKQPLNETELALRREETARKRKNLSEKKLADEKAETINRLLRKQSSRTKNKRANIVDSSIPGSGTRTPKAKLKTQEDGEEAEGDEDEDDAMEVVEPPEEVKPIMYRWVSSLKGDHMSITLSIPENIIPPQTSSDSTPAKAPIEEEDPKVKAARGPGICAVEGCGKPRKYRVPKDWTVGACDATHLKLVASRI
ncbi:hypothetical protein CVT24_007373 [Panaeolus cyanescens]|uniref:INO80 complex subunit B-like conserved region domain-containing protein n=1 Tax=Panaeolus cyanescens TaxID=181874 RepID=A0A409YL23_9AGAR|nr:hypothetical protein CVT24_007373 [Panaeolus cyanescens]